MQTSKNTSTQEPHRSKLLSLSGIIVFLLLVGSAVLYPILGYEGVSPVIVHNFTKNDVFVSTFVSTLIGTDDSRDIKVLSNGEKKIGVVASARWFHIEFRHKAKGPLVAIIYLSDKDWHEDRYVINYYGEHTSKYR